MFKYNQGNLLFYQHLRHKISDHAGAMCSQKRFLFKDEVDALPHFYYHGMTIEMLKDEGSGLFTPQYEISTPPKAMPTSEPVRQNYCSNIDSKLINL